MKRKDKTRITVAKMRFMRCVVKHTWMDCKRNEDLLKELKREPVVDKLSKHKIDWIWHVNRM
jgi:hypothetical protein